MAPPVLTAAQREQAQAILNAAFANEPGLEAGALITSDGHMAVSILQSGTDADRFGAMCSALLALASRAGREVKRGDLQQLVIDGSEGFLVLTRAGEQDTFALAANRSVQLGKVILTARNTANKLAALASSPGVTAP